MGVLTESRRKLIPKGEFGLPGQRAYPVENKAHASNAKARATQQYKRGNLSANQRAQINAKANKVLRKSGGRGS